MLHNVSGLMETITHGEGRAIFNRRAPRSSDVRAVDNFYSLGGHNRSECQCGLNFIGTYKPTCIHNLI